MTATTGDYHVSTQTREGLTIHVLEERATGARAEFLSGLGANCIRLQLAANGTAHDLLPPVDIAELKIHPTKQGMPVLFPFPGLVSKARYRFEDKTGALHPALFTNDNYHGFAFSAPWRVTRHEATDAGAVIEQELTSGSLPDMETQYPFPFRLRLRHTLRASVLTLRITLENTSPPSPPPDPDTTGRIAGRTAGHAAKPQNLPFGIGLHPYIRWPLAPAGGDPDACRFTLDATHYWADGNKWMHPERLPVTAENDPRPGLRPRTGMSEHYTGISVSGDGWSESRFTDPVARLTVVLRMREEFGIQVFFVPASHPDTVSIEAYTAIPNAINLQALDRRAGGHLQTGLRILPPGGRFETSLQIALQATFDLPPVETKTVVNEERGT
ncbi:MAG: aldose 1-epimerase [Opitutaceae bacterium]|nr:aldose 1-epimerase [Opitutaceae bacterium]